MLTDHMGVNVLWIDAAMSSQKTTETSGVESGTRTKHTSNRRATLGRVTGSEVRHHVHWIGCDNENSLRRTRQDSRNDFAEHLCIALKKLEAGLSRLLADAGTDQNHLTAGQSFVVT
jgi:hypothetical protein